VSAATAGAPPLGPPEARWVRPLARAVIAAWIPAVVVVCAYLLGAHLLTLPAPPPTDPRLARSLAALRVGDARGRWVVLHFLYDSCRCSNLVLEHLVARRASPDALERVVLIDGTPAAAARLRAAGYAAEAATRDGLVARFGFEAAPVMVVADPGDRVRYLGGYSERKQAPVLHDVEILRRARAGAVVRALPLFGCAVSARLQGAVDPLGLRR
jgi:hypothetical protein